MKKIVKRIAAMGAAVMMMSSMAIGASAYNSGDTYSSATWTISAKYTQSTKSITKTLKAGNKVKINNGTTKNVIITSWTGQDEVLYSNVTFSSPNGSNKVTIDKRDNYEYFITMTSSYKPTAEVKNKITLNNYDEDDIKINHNVSANTAVSQTNNTVKKAAPIVKQKQVEVLAQEVGIKKIRAGKKDKPCEGQQSLFGDLL